MRQAESFFRRNLTSSTPWKMSKYKHMTTQMTIFWAQNRKKISNYALPFGITVQRKLAASRGKSTALKFKICFQFYLWHQIRQHHTALDSHDLFKTIHSKVRCLFIILQGKRKSQTWEMIRDTASETTFQVTICHEITSPTHKSFYPKCSHII